MLKVEQTLAIDIPAYLREEYEAKGRSLKDIAQDITAKTNGQIRINYSDVHKWLEICRINTRSVWPRELGITWKIL